MSNLGKTQADKMAEAIENRLQQIAKQIYNQVPNDREVEGVASAFDSTSNTYTVRINNKDYLNIPQERGLGQIALNTRVKVKIPNNQMSNAYICGIVDGTSLNSIGYRRVGEPIEGVNPFNNYYTKDETIKIISNTNLLINGDFRVNQRGQTFYDNASGGGYCVDRWWAAKGADITVNSDNSITLTNSSGTISRHIIQWIENYEFLFGKQITISMKVKNAIVGENYRICLYDGTNLYGNITKSYTKANEIVSNTIEVPYSISANKFGAIIYPKQTAVLNDSINIEWVKLELGSVATPFSPRPYAEELATCQRYYQQIPYEFMICQYSGASNSYYPHKLICPMRATPILTNKNGEIRSLPQNTTLTSASLTVNYYNIGYGDMLRFYATHNTNITQQITQLYLSSVNLDAEIY